MKRRRRLAGAGGATDDEKSRRRARDELELVRVDEARDLGQMLVGAPAYPDLIRTQLSIETFADAVGTQG